MCLRIRGSLRDCSGQATVEAAFALPILLGLVLLLVQPGIILYDRMVMGGAAAEGCRTLATLPAGDPDGICEDLIRRRLGAIPQQEAFHVHDGSCSWEIDLEGGKGSSTTKVAIKNKVKPLPLIDFACKAFGASDGDGYLTVRVEASLDVQPDWI